MSEELAKAVRPRRIKDAPPESPSPNTRRVAPLLSRRTDLADAQAAHGNAALAARNVARPPSRAPDDALRSQSEFGNSAVSRAARAGELNTLDAPLPAYMPPPALDAPATTSEVTDTAPEIADPFGPANALFPMSPTPSFLYMGPTVGATATTLFDFNQPASRSGAESEEVTTIVFDEEQIVAGRTEKESEEEKEAGTEKQDAKESVEAARKIEGEEDFKEEEATEEAKKKADEAGPAVEGAEAEKEKKKQEQAKPEEVVKEAEAGAEEVPPEQEVEKAETAAGEEGVEAGAVAEKESVAKDAAPAKKEGAEGGAAPELEEWKSKVSGATHAIQKPDMGDAAGAGARVHTAGGAASGRASASREGIGKEAEAVVPPPPKPPDPLPPPAEDPVPEATQRIRDASDKKLPNQQLPAIVATPGGNMPKIGAELSGAYATKVTTASEIATAEKVAAEGEEKDAKGGKNPDKERAKKIKDAAGKKADAEGKEGAGEPMVLVDEGPPPPPTLTKAMQPDVGKVLAVLVSDPQGAAKEIVTDARRAAYPKGMLLESNYDDFGDEALPEVQTSITEQLDKVREQAGISKEELDKNVAERRKKTEEEGKKATEDVGKAGEEEKTKLEEEGQKTSDAIAGARDAVDENVERKVEAAGGETDPTVIKSKRERLIRGVSRKVAQQSIAYTKAGERRDKSLTDMGTAILTGYTLAARKDEQTIYENLLKEGKAEKEKEKEEARQAAARQAAGEAAKPSFVWLKEKLAEVNKLLGQLKADAKAAATSFDTAVKAAGDNAIEAIRGWAESLLGKTQSFWEWLMDLFSDWSAEAEEKSAAWEETRTAEARDGIVRDLEAMELVKKLEARKIDGKLAMGMAGLTEEQRAVIKAYYEGPTKGDSIAAVAAGLRARLSAQRRPDLIQKFESKLLGLPAGRWKDIDLIAEVQRPGGNNAYKIASEVHGAVDQWGTDEDRIYRALANLTPLRAAAARKCYTASGWGDMDADIEDEMSGAELDRAQAQLSGDQALADAAALREAMKGGLTGIGTDEGTIMQVLRNKTAEERKAIIEAYKREYGDDLEADLDDEMSGHDIDRANALMEGDTAKADAIAIDQAMHGGLTGLGTDEKDIEAVYVQIRQEVEAEAAAKGWTTAQVEAEIKKRNNAVEKKYDEKYDTGEDGMSLREAFEDELSGPDLDLAIALQDNDVVAADIARIEIEKQSIVYASDEAINNVLRSQGDRARKEVERDEKLAMQERAEIDALRGFPWDKKRWESERAALDERIEKKTDERAHANMSALEKSYDAKYSKFGSGGLRLTLAMNMSGSDQDMAFDLLKQGGILRPEQEIDYAVDGLGTDEDAVKKVLAGKSPAQIKKIREAWEAKHPGESFNERVLSEFSGRDRFDIEVMLDGEPQTPQEKLAQAKKKLDYEKNGYLLGGAFSKDERKRMEAEAEDLERDVKRLESLKEGTEEYERANERYRLQSEYFEQSVENHRAAVDSLTDTLATIAGIVATIVVIVVAVVLTVASGGAAAPGILAALGTVMSSASVAATAAGAAALATVGTKLLMKGSAYGIEDIGIDLAVGAADAIASYATAGLGGKLLKMGKLATLSKSGKMLPRLFANAMAEGAEGFASSLPSALTGAALNDRNWKGDPFSNIMGSAMVGVGMGTVLSGGMGMLGGISKPAAKAAGEVSEGAELLAEQAAKHPPVETPDVIARRGTATERLAGFDSFQKANPGKSYDDFIAELDAGVLTHKADDEAVQQMNKRLRDELFSAIPPGERDQFKDVALDVISDAEFERLTKSAKGQAVVLIEEGKPRVVLRESADPKALREEGIHLLQSADPEKAHLFKQLDESVLSKWDDLPLDEQISLYGKKLDLEIDGQKRLISNLEDALDAVGDDAAARKQLLTQLEDAERTLDNLSKRLDDVADLTPAKRLDIATGKAAKPDYLDQPARLFTKKDRLTIKRDLVAKLKAAGHDAQEANRVLENLRNAAEKKGLSGAFDTISGHAGKLPAAKAKAFLDNVGKALDAWEHAPDSVLGLVAASTKMKDPNAFLRAAAKLAGEGKAVERVSAEALENVAGKVSGLRPEAAQKFLNSLNDVIDAYPKKAGDLSGFMVAAAKLDEPGPFLSKLKDFSETLKTKKVDFDGSTLREIGEAVGKLDADKAAKYFDAVDDLFKKHPNDLQLLDGFLLASTKTENPGRYLELVKDLNARRAAKGIDSEAVEILARKAAAGDLDLEWLAQTKLFTDNSPRSNKILNFFALDPKTKWKTFMEASAIKGKSIKEIFSDSKLRNKMIEAWRSLKGGAGEMLVEARILKADAMDELIKKGIKGIERQKKLTGTISDFLVKMTDDTLRGIEVKSFSETFWRNMLKGMNDLDDSIKKGMTKDAAEALLKKEQRQALHALDHLIEQLNNSAKSLGQQPFLVVGDTLKNLKNWGAIEQAIKTKTGLKEIIFMSDDEVKVLTKEMKSLLGLPF